MKKREEAKWLKAIMVVLMVIASIAAVEISAYLYGKEFRDMFIMLVLSGASFLIVVFSLVQSGIYGTLHYDNGAHYSRFVITFMTGICVSCLMPLIPDSGWALPSFALAFALFSNLQTGVIAYASVLGAAAFLASSDVMIYILYFISGCIFIIMFDKLDEDYRTGYPMFMSMSTYAIAIMAKTIFQSYGVLTFDIFVFPIMNIFITFILMLGVLRFYCAVVIDKEKGKYIFINDQEFKLLAKYKETNRELYYNAIHTAYFAEKTARLLHMDVDVAKNGGYYHRIIAAECKSSGKTLEEVCREYKFPPKAVRLLQEYNYKSQDITMRETAAVYLSDSVVAAISYLIDKNKAKNTENGENAENANNTNKTDNINNTNNVNNTANKADNNTANKAVNNIDNRAANVINADKKENKADYDYAKLAIAVIKRKVDSGVLNKSELSFADMIGINRIFTGEKLYYDFLRGE